MKPRVIVVDDDNSIREGLSFALKAYGEFELIGSAENGAKAIALCEQLQPDIVFMDMMMPVMNGAEATRIIMEAFPTTIIIILSGLLSNSALIADALQAGALYVFYKDEPILEIMAKVRRLI